jgi:hypothetical protein
MGDHYSFDEVANQVKTIEGVLEFNRNEKKPNLIMIAYNASQIRSLTMLNKITRLGSNASLVGI